jgi:hypothetical protein
MRARSRRLPGMASLEKDAVALGKKKGGLARAAAMTKTERSESAKQAALARWSGAKELVSGTLKLGKAEIPCYVLDDETRVLSMRGLIGALNMSSGSIPSGASRLVRFVSGLSIGPHVSEDLRSKIEEPIRFRTIKGAAEAHGYDATVLADLCDAVLAAREAGDLQKQQRHIAKQCEILVRGFARVGIVALVDEATGYQYARDRRALAEILEAFVAKELARWAKTFPEDYYREMFRLRGLRPSPSDDSKRPQYFGHLTNDIVYKRLAPAVLDELKRKNPTKDGRRRSAHHQWLTRDVGHPKLMAHLGAVVAVMKLSPDWDQFVANLDRVAPRYGDTLTFDFEPFEPARLRQPESF